MCTVVIPYPSARAEQLLFVGCVGVDDSSSAETKCGFVETGFLHVVLRHRDPGVTRDRPRGSHHTPGERLVGGRVHVHHVTGGGREGVGSRDAGTGSTDGD